MSEHFGRLTRVIGSGGIVFCIGLGLQAFLVYRGMSVLVAYSLQLAATTLTIYLISRYLIWHNRVHDNGAMMLFFGIQVVMTLIAWGLFVILTEKWHVQHLFANGLSVASGTAIKYALNDWLVFKKLPEAEPI